MSFLSTVGCRIDENNGKLSFDVEDDRGKFNWFKASNFPSISDECHRVDVVDYLGKKFLTLKLVTF